MEKHVRGRCIKLGDSINTDVILPARYMVSIDPKELGEHAFEPLGLEFLKQFRNSKIVVAGKNFGCGSAREQAATCLVGAGIQAIVAQSFARVFFRNAINAGLLVVESPEAALAINNEDEIELDYVTGTIKVGEQGFKFDPYSKKVQLILESGGLIPYIEKHVLEK